MIRVAFAVARCDVARWLRSPTLLAATLIPALGMTLMVLALTYAVGRQPVALVQLGHGPTAKRLERILRESDGFWLKPYTPEQAARALRKQWVAGAITIPADIEEAAAGNKGHLDALINNVDLDFSDDIRRSVSKAAVSLDAPSLAGQEDESETNLGGKVKSRPEANPYLVDLSEIDLRRPDVPFLIYQMVSVFALLALTAGLLVTALSIAGDRESGTLRILALAPASRLAVVCGHLAAGVAAAMLLTTSLLVPLALAGALNAPPSRWPAIAALLLATAMGSTGVGVLVGLATRRVTTTVLLGVNVASASFLLGGGFTTVAFLPPFLQAAARATPTYYAVEGLREALFYTEMPGLARNLGVLLAFGISSVVIGAWLLARPMRQKNAARLK